MMPSLDVPHISGLPYRYGFALEELVMNGTILLGPTALNYRPRMRSAMRQVLVSAGIVLAFASCTMFNKQAVDQVRSDFPCPGPLVEESIANETRKVSGCGMENAYGYDSGSGKWISVKQRATFDMSCPPEKLTVHHLGGNTVGIEGCEKKAVYLSTAVCGGGGCSFRGWILNSEAK